MGWLQVLALPRRGLSVQAEGHPNATQKIPASSLKLDPLSPIWGAGCFHDAPWPPRRALASVPLPGRVPAGRQQTWVIFCNFFHIVKAEEKRVEWIEKCLL